MKIISGTQPTGEIHIGNYLGAIKKWVELQEKKENSCMFFIADYHGLTSDTISSKEKKNLIENFAINLISLGLNPEKSILFIQSHIPETTELSWVFNCLTPIGELERMTQYKDKKIQQKENINVGLFSYPTLMAADILLYNVDAVPVGEDQLQHLELTRETARRFNKKYGEFFKEPKAILTRIPRLMSLNNPLKKMSKSVSGSYIGVFDEPKEIEKKIKSAVSADNTLFKRIYLEKEEIFCQASKKGKDNSDYMIMEAGVKNLLNLLREFNSEKFNDIFENEEADFNKLRYGEIKDELSNSIIQHFSPFRKKREELLKDKEKVIKVYMKGSEKAREIARKNMEEIKRMIGLV
jgi:tryptophanyl-tRNA synthetase